MFVWGTFKYSGLHPYYKNILMGSLASYKTEPSSIWIMSLTGDTVAIVIISVQYKNILALCRPQEIKKLCKHIHVSSVHTAISPWLQIVLFLEAKGFFFLA